MQRVHIRQPTPTGSLGRITAPRKTAARNDRGWSGYAARGSPARGSRIADQRLATYGEHIREDFCGLCAAVPLAFAGIVGGGAAGGASLTAKQYADRKTITLVVCAFFVIISLILLASYWNCATCSVRPR
jgi:hypothetical protein